MKRTGGYAPARRYEPRFRESHPLEFICPNARPPLIPSLGVLLWNFPRNRRDEMSSINFQRTYHLGAACNDIEKRAYQKLEKYWKYQNLITFNAEKGSVTFTSERIMPTSIKKRPKVMFLFSNPHPHSVNQGMFLSPNTKGRENLFWPVMKEAGWLSISNEPEDTVQLAEIFVRAEYDGPFELIFYCYFAFPTDYPEDIRRIFGREYFDKNIEPEAAKEFGKTLSDVGIEAVVTFNKGIFNHVAQHPVDRYIKRLKAGELIQSQVKDVDRVIPIFLTYPTSWRYHRDFLKLRENNLDKIKKAINRPLENNGRENT
jgi:hypothetical protein